MAIDGAITKNQNGTYEGWIANLTFDVEVKVTPNPFKTKDVHPDFHIAAASPKGRAIRIGSAWDKTSKAGNEYLSLAININGSTVRANAIFDEEQNFFAIRAWAD